MNYDKELSRVKRRYESYLNVSKDDPEYSEKSRDYMSLTILSLGIIREQILETTNNCKEIHFEIFQFGETLKNEFKVGEILYYLWEMRNSVAHGLDEDLSGVSTKFMLCIKSDKPTEIKLRKLEIDNEVKLSVEPQDPTANVQVVYEQSGIALTDSPNQVSSRAAKRKNLTPNNIHLGKTIKNDSIQNQLKIAIDYYRKKINTLNHLLEKHEAEPTI